MSKQIAQTVGDKRIAWLLAILAAFAVLATLTTQWQQSKATVTPGSYTVTGPFADDDCTDPAATIWSGTTVYYCLTKAADATLAGNLQVTFQDVPGVNFTGAVLPVSGPTPTCLQVSGDTQCTYAGLTATSTFVLAAAAVVTTTQAAGTINVLVDDEDIANATVTGGSIVTVLNLENAFVKAPTGNPAAGGGPTTYTITFTSPATAPIIAIGNLDIADAFAGVTGAALTGAVLSGTNAADMSCSAVAAGSFTCTNTAAIDPNDTFVVTVTATVPANPTNATRSVCNTATVTLIYPLTGAPAGNTTVSDEDEACTNQVAVDAPGTGLVHVPSAGRDRDNNVIGYRHTVCALNDVVDAVWPNVVAAGTGDNFKITTISGTATIEAPVVTSPTDCDADGYDDDSTVSWYSTSTGEQDIVVVNDAGSTQYGYSGSAGTTVPLVKEWNTLAPTWITASKPVVITDGNPDTLPASGNLDGTIVKGAMAFNPATGEYQGVSSTYYENPIATHTNAGGTQLYIANGATVTFTRDANSTCGAVIVGAVTLSTGGTSTTVTSAGVGIPFSFDSEVGAVTDCTSPTGWTRVKIQVSYPTDLGSDNPPNPAEETLRIDWTGQIAEKQVFLAWAGQRIVLEHDWRLAPGDGPISANLDGPVPLGTSCAFDDGRHFPFTVKGIKGTGPGNFVAGLNATINGNDEAIVTVGSSDLSQSLESVNAVNDSTDNDDDINNQPQDNCISRLLYESEDPGEVDIEVFAWGPDNENATKIAYVIYYMKINTINVSLVTQVSKPTHNSSLLSDYAPGNPWDASKDDADNAADWNVSKDLLVRGRVTGWFTNSNPSGRAADTSNPLNVLPANRWVMPNDWPLLAGGPADPAEGTDAVGTAEQFRPYYDIMFAPNNARGLALFSPEGADLIQATVVATGNTGNGQTPTVGLPAGAPIKVLSCADLPSTRGAILVGATGASVSAVYGCSGTSLYLATALTSAPAAGTPIYFLSGVPFEGPYSTLDILGLAADGKGGAALSNLIPGSIRDTANDDGDVDMWDAPMPPAPVSVAIRGTGFIKQVIKSDVYYLGTPNVLPQSYTNPFYIVNIPDSPFIPSQAAGGGFLWNSWSNDGPGGQGQGVYRFWQPAFIGTNSEGIGETLGTADTRELNLIRGYFGDPTIARDLVVFSDNHGEFMVTANGDFKTDLTACTTNVLAGGKHCKPGDKVGTGSITATVDYPDFRGKHFPVLSNAATVTWTWGGYKDVTVEKGETDQYKYIVFHAMDRDGFCSPMGTYATLLHSVLSSSSATLGYTNGVVPGVADDYDTAFTIAALGSGSGSGKYYNDPVENVDFLIDSGEGIIIGSSDPLSKISDGKQFATDVWTFSTYENEALGKPVLQFAKSSLAAADAKDECQAWIKVSNSLLGILNVLAIAHDDEGNIGFDKIIDLTNTTSYTLNFRWSLVTWAGADAISVSDAIKGTGTSGKNPGGNDISASVTAIYGWDAAAQQWLGYFPSGVNVPGANDLVSLKTGSAFWIAITGPSSVTWTIASNVN